MIHDAEIEGTPLVLLPGLMCDRTVWEGQLAAFGDLVEPLVFEWRREHDSIEGMAEAVLRAAAPVFALAGHSMGSRVAFEIYRRAPERVTRLAVLNTGVIPVLEGAPGLEEERGRRRLLAIARSDGVRAMAQEWVRGMLAPARLGDRDLVERIVQMFERRDADMFEAQTIALLGRPDARPVLSLIHCPTLVLTGADDRWSPPARHQEIADAVAGATLVLVPGSGHMSPMEDPTAVSRAMREWLA